MSGPRRPGPGPGGRRGRDGVRGAGAAGGHPHDGDAGGGGACRGHGGDAGGGDVDAGGRRDGSPRGGDEGGVSPREGGRPGRSRAGRQPTAWKALFFVLACAAIVAGVAWALLGSRFLVVRSIRVTGTGREVPRARVLAAAGIGVGLPLVRVDTAAVAHRVERITQVLSARVSRDWPDSVVISIRVRTPVFAVRVDGGYGLVDPHGVEVRQTGSQAGLPLLTLGTTTAVSPAALRGSAAVRAAAIVLHELPRQIGRRVRAVTAAGASDVSVRLADGVVIVWGGTSRSAEKERELAVLMRTHARLYNVSAPVTAVTQG